MQDDATAATYRYEFRGTVELPQQVLEHHRQGTLKKALELCDEYGCQILLKDLADPTIQRGWVRPNGHYLMSPTS